MNGKRIWMASSLALLLMGSAQAEEMPVPVELQGRLFKKILSYDRTLRARNPQILVVYGGDPTGDVGDIVWAFQEVGLNPSASSDAELPQKIGEAAVVYLVPGADVVGVKSLCETYRVLTITGIPKLAEEGDVSIGLGARDNKPEIVVHLARVKAEGHDFSSELLRLSRVIR